MKSVLCYGDSITWGFNPADQTRFAFDVRWPGVVQTKLGADYRVIEEGLSGRTVATARRPIARLLLENEIPIDPLVLLLCAGDL
ncbi:MAG TPA: lipolytic enzyme, G-D-S-L, partial [Casimicrobiaceae bacterium]|nr:lipolytic enzyme, G-D-S-L [Casimicrobiaceae bacterium]